MKNIIFTVTNDLNHDQRMIRICSSLADAGYTVTLVGLRKAHSSPITQRKYRQKRLGSLFKAGFGFYAEYNIRLLFYLIFQKADILCSIDLDTILPVWLVCRLKNKKGVYDAHEYFPEQKEVISRPGVYKVWKWIELTFVPRFKDGYTVCESIAIEFKKLYGVEYKVIRNVPVLKPLLPGTPAKNRLILYQGAVNEARGLEFLIPAMKNMDARLDIYGDGNFMEQTKKLIIENNLQDKVFMKGKVLPEKLNIITRQAYMGINLVENNGLNQYYSLANKFFDYIQNGLPQVTMNFPEYKKINDEFEVSVLINSLQENDITSGINKLLDDEILYQKLQKNCLKAREILNWQNEEMKLIRFYKELN